MNSRSLRHELAYLWLLLEGAPISSWQQAAEVDYRKSLIAEKMIEGLGLWKPIPVNLYGDIGAKRITDDSSFVCIDEDQFDTFKSDLFLVVRSSLQSVLLLAYTSIAGRPS
jgi:hypothetical protein